MPLVFTTLDQKAMIQWWHLDLHQVDVYHAAHDPRTQAAPGTEFHGEVGAKPVDSPSIPKIAM